MFKKYLPEIYLGISFGGTILSIVLMFILQNVNWGYLGVICIFSGLILLAIDERVNR